MRKKIIAGNWKMNMNLPESISLISQIKNYNGAKTFKCDVILCPPFTSLDTARTLIKGSVFQLGAQNMHAAESGAFTGEISASMLKSVGCEYVILGHSERRTLFNETDNIINKKVLSALSSNLKPIFCVGETLEERKKGITFDIVKRQMAEGLKEVDLYGIKNIIIAYEPVWAIGTGKTATPAQAEEVHAFIRSLLKESFGQDISERIIIQYGGSVKPDNAKEILHQPNVDGALVGGACIKAESFLEIIKAC
ncbi:MAG: triose-phosphate isomerase [Chlorobiaceae bacterium]|nr:triose-phosphate isomerase [Chlorobiaceae bacterium]MBA4309020.1 triose-phosphate isomerase [Chlorobiaceae bacterium]